MDLARQQRVSLWLEGHPPLGNPADAARFMASVGFALRYNATPSLPLAAMYNAVGDTRRAIELTNALLASGEVVESNVIAGRLVLIHRERVAAVVALRRRHRREQTPLAERVLRLIRQEGHATAGEVRRFLGVSGQKRPDSGDLALGELQRGLLIDRGPSSVPKKGIPYLSPEGFPYRLFDQAHPALIRAASTITPENATIQIIESYLRAALFVSPRKLAAMFRLLFSENEMSAALERLENTGKISRTAKCLTHVDQSGAAQ
jgi:hypothetical protein